jgi:hypothetical protein
MVHNTPIDRRYWPRPHVVETILAALAVGRVEHVRQIASVEWLTSATGKRCKTLTVVRNSANGREIDLSHGEALRYAPHGSLFTG